MGAVHEQDGYWPFRQAAFQFSLHIRQKEDGGLAHHYYLANGTQHDPESTPHINHREIAEILLSYTVIKEQC